jgi:transcriptional regulator with XRE-family HTH domain
MKKGGIPVTIGEKIKARRKELKMTTEELGRLIGVQRSAITKYEKNRVDLKSKQIQEIANALDINPALLLSDDPLELSPDEEHLLSLWRGANDQARSDVIDLLEKHQRKKEETHTA